MKKDNFPVTFVARTLRLLQRQFLWVALIVFVIWTYSAFAIGQYSVYRAYPNLTSTQQATHILASIGKLIQLPVNETPTMAIINNATSAKKVQAFLANAEDGDVLIVYQKAAEAILYRPSTNKLIAVGPIDAAGTAASGVKTSVRAPTSASSQTTTSTTNATNTKTKK